MFQILLKTAQELKTTNINLFKNTNAPLYFNQKLYVNFVDFQTEFIRFYEKMNQAYKDLV